eukprot:2910439-Amphidinium_carterae.2
MHAQPLSCNPLVRPLLKRIVAYFHAVHEEVRTHRSRTVLNFRKRHDLRASRPRRKEKTQQGSFSTQT